jgi:hypothetical protein
MEEKGGEGEEEEENVDLTLARHHLHAKAEPGAYLGLDFPSREASVSNEIAVGTSKAESQGKVLLAESQFPRSSQ